MEIGMSVEYQYLLHYLQNSETEHFHNCGSATEHFNNYGSAEEPHQHFHNVGSEQILAEKEAALYLVISRSKSGSSFARP
mmetsp:Transcript_8319/g.14508  ORF Transcript_8319/g.14508 Transcript_8319/m.14508 type:complete len:80 (-) Transcript_8319:520-759(-)